jgi:hypothetical protein
MEKSKQSLYHARLKAEGKCLRCRHPVVPGMSLCEPCRKARTIPTKPGEEPRKRRVVLSPSETACMKKMRALGIPILELASQFDANRVISGKKVCGVRVGHYGFFRCTRCERVRPLVMLQNKKRYGLTCSDCFSDPKPSEDFGCRKTGRYMQKPYSRNLIAVRTREWRAKNPGRQKALQGKRTVAYGTSSTRARRARNKDSGKCIRHGEPLAFGSKRCLFCWDVDLGKRYSIDIGEYVRMLVSQKAQCAICHKVAPLRVDHNHTSGAVRGLVCSRCNILVGYWETSEDGILNSVSRYLSVERKDGVA